MGYGNKGSRFGFGKFQKGGQGGSRQTRFGNDDGGFKAGINQIINWVILAENYFHDLFSNLV